MDLTLLRRALWLAFSLFPVWSYAAIFAGRGVVRSYWWILYAGLVVAHYFFVIVHPLFNRNLESWKVRGGWAAMNLMFYPLGALLYAWFGTAKPVRTAT